MDPLVVTGGRRRPHAPATRPATDPSGMRQRGRALTVILASVLGVCVVVLALAAGFVGGALQSTRQAWPFEKPDPDITRRNSAKEEARLASLWTERLRKGGYILYFRHAERERWPNVEGYDIYALATAEAAPVETSYKRAVCLTPRGIEDAKLIGHAFRLLAIPVSTVVSSPSCRALETAQHAFGKITSIEPAILHPTARREPDHASLAARLRKLLLETPIPAGTNLVISGHNATLGLYGERVVDTSDLKVYSVEETGFVILERRGDRLHAAAKFPLIKDLLVHALEVPERQ